MKNWKKAGQAASALVLAAGLGLMAAPSGVSSAGAAASRARQATPPAGIHPAVGITSIASQPSVIPGTTVTFTLDVTNRGDTPLTDVAVTAPGCGPLAGPSKPAGNVDGTLEVAETWQYACDRVVTEDVGLTFSVQARDPNRPIPVSAQSYTAVQLARPGVFLAVSPDRSVVAAGTPVQFTFDVTSGDHVPLTDVTLSVPGCHPVSEPAKLGGDGDGALEAGETWRSTCSLPVHGETTQVATVSAQDLRWREPITSTGRSTVGVVNPRVAVVETVTPGAVPGEPTTRLFTVTNTGDTSLAGIGVISELGGPIPLPGGDHDGDGLLDPGPEFRQFQSQVRLSAPAMDRTTVAGQDIWTGTRVLADTLTSLPATSPVLAAPAVPPAQPNLPAAAPAPAGGGGQLPEAGGQFPDDFGSDEDSSPTDESSPTDDTDTETTEGTETTDEFETFDEFDTFEFDTFESEEFDTFETFEDDLPATGFGAGRLITPGLLLAGTGVVLTIAGRRRKES